MNLWLYAAAVLTAACIGCGIAAIRGGLEARIVAVQLGSTVGVLALLTAAQGFGRSIYADVAITLAILSFGGTLALARFMERWL